MGTARTEEVPPGISGITMSNKALNQHLLSVQKDYKAGEGKKD